MLPTEVCLNSADFSCLLGFKYKITDCCTALQLQTDVIKAQRWRRTMNDCACFCHMLTHNLEFAHEKQEREYTDHPAGKVVPGPPLWSGSPAKNTGTSQWLRQRCSHSLEPGAELHFPLLSLKGSLPLAWYHCPPHFLLCPESLPTDLTSLGTS